MADVPVAEGGRGGGKKNNWLVIGALGGGGVLLLMLLLQKQGGGSPATTAAGTSINAALGSIQEQNLNIMGEVGSSEQRLTDELKTVNSNIIAGTTSDRQAIASNTYMNYYQQAAGVAQILAADALRAGDIAGYQGWTDYANQFTSAIEQGRVGGMGVGNEPAWQTSQWWGNPSVYTYGAGPSSTNPQVYALDTRAGPTTPTVGGDASTSTTVTSF